MRKGKSQDTKVIKKLRMKFVIVTMVLMTTTLGIPYIYDYVETLYWENNSTLLALEDCVNTGSLDPNDLIIDDYYGEPVYMATLDKDKNITSVTSSSGSKTLAEDVITGVVDNGVDNHKWKHYAYVLKQYDGGYRVAIINTANGLAGLYRKLLYIMQIAIALLVILVISLLLSKFVTRPAHSAINREKQFISDASHELKTPLSAISINAQALQPEIGENKHLQNIISEARRMDELIKNLLKLSYMDEIGGTLEKHSLDLSQCCNEIALSMESSIYEKSISFNYDIADNISFTGNETNIKQLIAILLDNALKHTPASGTIDFSLKSRGRKIYMTVSNSGPGIPPEDLPHIFERFYRVDKSRQANSSGDTSIEESSNNYGLGLAIAKSIVDAHNGTITATSDYGNGATLTVELPLSLLDKRR